MHHKKIVILLLQYALLLGFNCQAIAGDRNALIIGNSQYESTPLKNPTNDAIDLSKALQGLGFDVLLRINSNQREMEQAIGEFGKRLEKGGVGLFYFSGHGIQSNGRNYLIPVGANLSREVDLRYKAVDAGRVLDEMGYANNGLNIAILDACRNNPLTRSFRGSSRGLAQINNAPKGLLIAYATSPGEIAMDGKGRNSPYTHHLIQAIKKEGQPLELVFKNIARKVKEETRGKQIPWVSSSVTGDFFFSGGSRSRDKLQIKNDDSYNVSADLLELEFWKSAEECNTAACFRAYIANYPSGRFVSLARARMDSRRQVQFEIRGEVDSHVLSSNRVSGTMGMFNVPSDNVRQLTEEEQQEALIHFPKEGYALIIKDTINIPKNKSSKVFRQMESMLQCKISAKHYGRVIEKGIYRIGLINTQYWFDSGMSGIETKVFELRNNDGEEVGKIVCEEQYNTNSGNYRTKIAHFMQSLPNSMFLGRVR